MTTYGRLNLFKVNFFLFQRVLNALANQRKWFQPRHEHWANSYGPGFIRKHVWDACTLRKVKKINAFRKQTYQRIQFLRIQHVTLKRNKVRAWVRRNDKLYLDGWDLLRVDENLAGSRWKSGKTLQGHPVK